jgi:hypothetical protein
MMSSTKGTISLVMDRSVVSLGESMPPAWISVGICASARIRIMTWSKVWVAGTGDTRIPVRLVPLGGESRRRRIAESAELTFQRLCGLVYYCEIGSSFFNLGVIAPFQRCHRL